MRPVLSLKLGCIAHRMKACTRACEGISTRDLEKLQPGDMLRIQQSLEADPGYAGRIINRAGLIEGLVCALDAARRAIRVVHGEQSDLYQSVLTLLAEAKGEGSTDGTR